MAAGDLRKKIRGIVNTIFQIGIGGPNLKNNSGVLEVRNAADSAYANVRANDIVLSDDDSNTLTLRTPANLGGNYFLEFPADDGSPGQVLETNGSGVMGWVNAATGNDKVITDTTALAFGTGSPLTMFTLPANAVVHAVKVIVDTVFNGTAPTLSIGIAGTTSKYMAATENDLKTTGVYEVDPGLTADGGTNALIATYAADSSSAGAGRIEVSYSIPS